jgi:hypothetical protein
MRHPEETPITPGSNSSQESNPQASPLTNAAGCPTDAQASSGRIHVESSPRGFKAMGPPARCM